MFSSDRGRRFLSFKPHSQTTRTRQPPPEVFRQLIGPDESYLLISSTIFSCWDRLASLQVGTWRVGAKNSRAQILMHASP